MLLSRLEYLVIDVDGELVGDVEDVAVLARRRRVDRQNVGSAANVEVEGRERAEVQILVCGNQLGEDLPEIVGRSL